MAVSASHLLLNPHTPSLGPRDKRVSAGFYKKGKKGFFPLSNRGDVGYSRYSNSRCMEGDSHSSPPFSFTIRNTDVFREKGVVLVERRRSFHAGLFWT
jgi:hypothetical protein